MVKERVTFEIVALSPLYLADMTETNDLDADGAEVVHVSLLSTSHASVPNQRSNITTYRITLRTCTAAELLAEFEEMKSKVHADRKQQQRAQLLRAQQDPTLSTLTSLRRQRRSDRAACEVSLGSSRARSCAGVSSLDRAKARNSSMRASLSHDSDWGDQAANDGADWLVVAHQVAHGHAPTDKRGSLNAFGEESQPLQQTTGQDRLRVLHSLAGMPLSSPVDPTPSSAVRLTAPDTHARRSVSMQPSLATVADEAADLTIPLTQRLPSTPLPPPPAPMLHRHSSSRGSLSSGGNPKAKTLLKQVDQLSEKVRRLSTEGTTLANVLTASDSVRGTNPPNSLKALVAAWESRLRC